MDIIIDSAKMTVMRLELSAYATNAYIVICRKTGKSALIDAPAGARTLVKNLKGTTLESHLFALTAISTTSAG